MTGADDDLMMEDEGAAEVVTLNVEVTALLTITGTDTEDEGTIEDIVDLAEELCTLLTMTGVEVEDEGAAEDVLALLTLLVEGAMVGKMTVVVTDFMVEAATLELEVAGAQPPLVETVIG